MYILYIDNCITKTAWRDILLSNPWCPYYYFCWYSRNQDFVEYNIFIWYIVKRWYEGDV